MAGLLDSQASHGGRLRERAEQVLRRTLTSVSHAFIERLWRGVPSEIETERECLSLAEAPPPSKP